MALAGNFGLRSQRSSTGPARTFVSVCLADLERMTQSFSWLLGRWPQRFPRSSPGSLTGQTWESRCGQEVVSEQCCFTFHFPTPLPQDYVTPEIRLYSEEGLKGEQVKLTEALNDPQSLERPLQVASATVSAGL